MAATWRYDSGVVAGAVPDYATALTLSGDQQAPLFDVAAGIDDLFGGGGRAKVGLRVTVVNLTNQVALYNFLSTFSGNHFVSHRTVVGGGPVEVLTERAGREHCSDAARSPRQDPPFGESWEFVRYACPPQSIVQAQAPRHRSALRDVISRSVHFP